MNTSLSTSAQPDADLAAVIDEHLADYPVPCTLTPEAERLLEAEAEAGL